jgi:hypothetical protein
MRFHNNEVFIVIINMAHIFTAETQRTQSELFFSFAAETPANENPHAFGNLRTFASYPPGWEFILFRPFNEKE